MAAISGVTELLLAWREGDERALEQLVPLVYDELRRIARLHMRRERPGQTLQATALVNEMYLRLIGVQQIEWRDRVHFFAMASRVMRRVLVEAARARRRDKRGGDAKRITFTEQLGVAAEKAVDVIALDDALEALQVTDPRAARVVELRFFGGLSVEEAASVLDVSANTIMRDWHYAKSWLRHELRKRAAS